MNRTMRCLVVVGVGFFYGTFAVYGAGLPTLRTLRSLSAEASLVVRLEHRHSLTSSYAAQMKGMIDKQLRAVIQDNSFPAEEVQWARIVVAALHDGDEVRLDHAQQALSRMVDAREKAN